MADQDRCECLHCFRRPCARLTVPKHKPRFLICEQHLSEMLAWAEPYRSAPGRVVVERAA
jgi:hypothetical protein